MCALSAELHWVRTTEVFQTTAGTILRSIHRNFLTFLCGGETCQCRSLEPYARKNKKKKEREIDKTRKGGEEMKEMKQKKDRDEVRSILADSSRDRRTLVLLYVPYFSPWLKLPPRPRRFSLSRPSPSLFVTSLALYPPTEVSAASVPVG